MWILRCQFKWQKWSRSMSVSSLWAHLSPAKEIVLHFYPGCTRSQQDLTLTERNKHTCMLVNTVSSQVLRCTQGHSKLIFSFWSSANLWGLCSYLFLGGNNCCILLKTRTESHAFANLPNTFHHPPRVLPRCHRAAGELRLRLQRAWYCLCKLWRRFRKGLTSPI